jgi:SAM-dependent methyltransferase
MSEPNEEAAAAAHCRAAYDRWAQTYDVVDNPLVAAAGVALEAHAARFAGARVLELGCGTGRNAAACLAAGAAAYVGVDASPGMLATARARFADEPRVTWLAADLLAGAAAACADGGRFDVVLICLVLEHVADVAPAIAAAAAALAADGRLIVLELHPALHERGVGAHFRDGDVEVRLPSLRHDAAELTAAATRAGLVPAAIVDHAPTPAGLARSSKLARHAGVPVLLEFVATRALSAAYRPRTASPSAPPQRR